MAVAIGNLAPTSGKAANISAWVIQALLAAAYVAAAGAKLAGASMMIATFEQIGIGQWFRYVTGAIEIGGAIALLTPGFAPLGAALLACTMVCAILFHLFLIGGTAVPACVLLILNIAVLYLRRAELRRIVLGHPA